MLARMAPHNHLIKLLDRILASTSGQRLQLPPRLAIIYGLENSALKELQKELAAAEDFKPFRNRTRGLAWWLTSRARTVGSEEAIREALDSLSAESFEAYAVMLLLSPQLESESEFDLGNGIAAVSWNKLPSRRLQEEAAPWLSGTPLPMPSGGLICRYSQQRDMFSQPPVPRLDCALLSLTMCREPGCAAQAVGTTQIVADNVPFKDNYDGTSWQLHSFRGPTFGSDSIEAPELHKAKEFHEIFCNLKQEYRDRLSIPIQCLNTAAVRRDDVDCASALRTALETLFLDDGNKQELSYRLALRAALFLGTKLEERIRLKKIVTEAYKLCSTAVHEGKLKNKNIKIDDELKLSPSELLRETRSIVWKTIWRRVQNHPKIRWIDFELASGA